MPSIPGLQRSPGEGNSNSRQYSCLEKPMDREAWQATVHRASKSQTWLSTHTQIKFLQVAIRVYSVRVPALSFTYEIRFHPFSLHLPCPSFPKAAVQWGINGPWGQNWAEVLEHSFAMWTWANYVEPRFPLVTLGSQISGSLDCCEKWMGSACAL